MTARPPLLNSPVRSPSQNGPGWLVSFGDLVTLLVCLFIALLAGSHGREFAPKGTDYVVTLFASDLSSDQLSLSEIGANKLKGLKISGAQEIRMQLCDRNFTALQVSRVLAVERQISGSSLSTGAPKGGGRSEGVVTLVGGRCASEQAGPEPLMLIEVVRGRARSGQAPKQV